MKDGMKFTAFAVLALLAVVALGWLLTANSLALQKVFAPAQEQVRRDTFEQSKAYRDGAVQELAALRVEYMRAAPDVKPAMASLIRHKAAGVPPEALPYDIALFLKEIQ